MRIKGFQLSMEIGKRSDREDINAPEQMVRWHPLIEIEFVEQSPLIRRLPPHHATGPPIRRFRQMNHGSPTVSNAFFNGITAL